MKRKYHQRKTENSEEDEKNRRLQIRDEGVGSGGGVLICYMLNISLRIRFHGSRARSAALCTL